PTPSTPSSSGRPTGARRSRSSSSTSSRSTATCTSSRGWRTGCRTRRTCSGGSRSRFSRLPAAHAVQTQEGGVTATATAGRRARGGAGSPRQATGGVLGGPGGPALVAIAGAVFIGVAAYQVYKGVSAEFLDSSKTHEMDAAIEAPFTVLGVAGHVARGLVFALIGYGRIKAAVDYDP